MKGVPLLCRHPPPLAATRLLPPGCSFLQSVVREWFSALSHSINTLSAAVLSVASGRSYRRTAAAARGAASTARSKAWHSWWQTGSESTFNALIEREGFTASPAAEEGTADVGDGKPMQQQSRQLQPRAATPRRVRAVRTVHRARP